MAPVLRGGRPGRDVGVPVARDDRAEVEVRLVQADGQRVRPPAEERDRAVVADVVEGGRVEVVVLAGRGAVLPGRREVDQGDRLAGELLEVGDRVHVPGRVRAGELATDPGAPVELR